MPNRNTFNDLDSHPNAYKVGIILTVIFKFHFIFYDWYLAFHLQFIVTANKLYFSTLNIYNTVMSVHNLQHKVHGTK